MKVQPKIATTAILLDPIAVWSWPGIIARVLAKWARGPRAQRRPRWYESDGAHRGF